MTMHPAHLCPKCEGFSTVTDTRKNKYTGPVRERVCKTCGTVWNTFEVTAVEDLQLLPPPLRRQISRQNIKEE